MIGPQHLSAPEHRLVNGSLPSPMADMIKKKSMLIQNAAINLAQLYQPRVRQPEKVARILESLRRQPN
jgi:hypothetical protein